MPISQDDSTTRNAVIMPVAVIFWGGLKIAGPVAVQMLNWQGWGSGQAAGVATSGAMAGSTLATANGQSVLYSSAKGPVMDPAPPVVSQGTTLTSAEAQSVLDTSVKDRTGDVLMTPAPGAPSLDKGKSSNKYKARRDEEKLVVAGSKKRLHGFGYSYWSASTTVEIVGISGTASDATVKFDESGTLYMTSDTTGPSNIPEQYRVHETAMFTHTDAGWVLDESVPDAGQVGLPLSIVDPSLTPRLSAPTWGHHRQRRRARECTRGPWRQQAQGGDVSAAARRWQAPKASAPPALRTAQ